MASLDLYLLPETQLTLHFQRLGLLDNTYPVVLRLQSVRLDFIQYCLSQGKMLLSEKITLANYLNQQKKTATELLTPVKPLSAADKLSILFSHLSALNYDLEGLTIEPVALADLIRKIQEINQMNDEDVADYLNKLIGDKIPGYEKMSMEEFLNKIEELYKADGVNFHCYLRENFSTSLEVNAINSAAPSLNYFMPAVFCQQHINSCDIATTMTMLKKVVTNFNQMQTVCFSNNEELPIELIQSREKIKDFEQQFDEFLKDPSKYQQENVHELAKNYLKEIETIQIEMEKALADNLDPDSVLFIKER